MKTRTVQIADHRGRGTIIVDGHDISGSVVGYTVSGRARLQLPEVKLELITVESKVDGQMVVTVPPATREALVLLGWTPPAEKDGA